MSGDSGSNHTAASFTDLMASLMVVFVLLFIAYVNNAAAKGKNLQDNLLATLQERLRTVGINQDAVKRDERDKNAIVVIMPDSALFDKGKSFLKSGGIRDLEKLMPQLASVLCQDSVRSSIQTVVVEGHTDTTWAITAGSGSSERGRDFNLELSQRRSMEVVLAGLNALSSAEDRACFRSLLSASGRGQEEPLPGVSGDDARQRRVVLKIRVASNLAEQLTKHAK